MSAGFLTLALTILAGDPLAGVPEVTKDQEKLIKAMGDNDYKTRELATAKLGKMDYAGLRAMHQAAKHADPEIAARANRLISDYYNCANSKKEIPGIQGLYEMKSFKLKSGKTMEIAASDANDYYTKAGGDATDDAMKQDATNPKTREATWLLVHKLRKNGYTKEEVTEILDKITDESSGSSMGETGWRKFREMQGLPEYDHWGPGCFGIGIRNMVFRVPFGLPPLRPFGGIPPMPRAID